MLLPFEAESTLQCVAELPTTQAVRGGYSKSGVLADRSRRSELIPSTLLEGSGVGASCLGADALGDNLDAMRLRGVEDRW